MAKAPRIDARMARFVVEDLRRRRIAVDELLKEVGLRRSDLASPEGRLPYAPVIHLMERAATTGFAAANHLLAQWGIQGHTLHTVPIQGRSPILRRLATREGAPQ